jgi:hypothetical protein
MKLRPALDDLSQSILSQAEVRGSLRGAPMGIKDVHCFGDQLQCSIKSTQTTSALTRHTNIPSAERAGTASYQIFANLAFR